MILKIIEYFIVAPGCFVTLLLLAILFWRSSKLAGIIVTLTMLSLYFLSTPFGARYVSMPLQEYAPLVMSQLGQYNNVGAIVVLGGGRKANAPDYGGDTVSLKTLARLRYAARLYRVTGLPILVSGGSVFGDVEPESELMANTLQKDFNVPVQWQESRSRNTKENADYTAALLQKQGIKRVFLVDQAVHMPRSVVAFRKAGVDVIPAPTDFVTLPKAHAATVEWLPSGHALWESSMAVHEYVGQLWYALRY